MIALGSVASDRAWEAHMASEQDRHDREVCGECGGRECDCPRCSVCDDCGCPWCGGDAA